jgi:hypothetical protein
MATRRAMPNNHGRSRAGSRSEAMPRKTRNQVSWLKSAAASSEPLRRRKYRQTGSCQRAMSTSKASRSPNAQRTASSSSARISL